MPKNVYFTKYDIVGNQKYFSDSVFSVLGYNPDELIGKNAYDYFHPLDIKQISSAHINILSKLTSAVYRIRHKNGTYVWVRSYSEIVDGDLISFTKKLSLIEILMFKIILLRIIN